MRLSLLLAAGISLFAASIIDPSPAWAQDPTPEEIERFQGHLQQGGTLLEEERYHEAIAELEEARQIIDHPRIALSIAGAYGDWGRCEQALYEYETLQSRDELSDDISERLERGLSRIQECVPMGKLTILCEPQRAVLNIDGQSSACPFEEERRVDDYQITVSLDGFQSHQETVSVSSHQETTLKIELQPEITPVEDDAPSDMDWIAMAGFGAIGLGSAVLIGGGFSDLSSRNRTGEIAAAYGQGDGARLAQLESEADSARLRTAILYGAGGIFLATGIALQFIDLSTDDSSAPQAGLSLSVSPTAFATTWRW